MLSPIDVSYPALRPGALAGTRKRIGLVVATTIGVSILFAAAALFWHAYQERHAIVHRGLSASVSAARSLEREVDAMGYLLKGLSRSPLLRSGDLEGFYNQLQATPRPEGAWFTLWDHDRVLLRTRDPFASALPRIDELPDVRDRLEVVRAKGLSMSDRMHSPFAGQWIVSVSLRLEDANGRMDRVLSLLIPEEHFNRAARDADDAAGWGAVLLDRKLQPIATGMEGRIVPAADVIRAVSGQNGHGHFESGHGQEANLVAFQRSPTTGYTILAVAPAAMADAPIRTAFHHTMLATLILLVIGSTSVAALLRHVGPMDSLSLTALATRAELLAANTRLAELLESMSDCHFTLDRSFRITFINAATLRWCGRSKDEIVGRSYLDLVGHRGDCVAAMAQAVEHRNPFQGELRSGLRPDRFIDLRAFPSSEGASVYFSDVTDRVLAHRAIVEERELLQSSLDALTQQIAILDERGRIIAVNQAWRRFAEGIGASGPAHGIGAGYLDVAVPGNRRFSAMEDVIAGLRPSFQALYQVASPGGDRWFTIRAFRFRIGDVDRILVSHEDVTELMTARASVSELSERLLTLQDEERQRIASELHDSTTQYLVAVGLNLMKVERLLPQQDGQRLLGEIDHLLEEALKELRLFTYLLHPASLDENGFADAVQAFADGFSDRTGLAVACRIGDGADGLRVEVRRALFRIVQEALSNVHRHADATRVVVDLRTTSGEVILCVADDGHGMQAKPAASKPGKPTLGVGIPGMRIRLHQFGGTLRIRTGRTGTVVRARIPRDPANLAAPVQ
ncbi:MAG TPA: PAS domain-containing protein [Microvirga sp.]|jgi:signal transduction histidine kinase|nr:PAS domain-containing protein [Microvirga sp.]